MKKFLIGCVCVLLLVLAGDYLYYSMGVYIPVMNSKEVEVTAKSEGKTILLNKEGSFEPFEIKGVNMGAGIPGKFATDFPISKSEYMRWFQQIQEMGANTIRVYTILGSSFYDAFYEYNENNDNPLYLIHGLWVNDYVQNSRLDAFAKQFLNQFIEDGKTLIDILHGKKKYYVGRGVGSGSYRHDISPWVIGYILGVEWEDVTVAYTNHMNPEKNDYQGKYMYTTKQASPFEAMLAQVGDTLIQYETLRYQSQRLLAFSNWPTTDPFDYSDKIRFQFNKIAKVNVEHIASTDQLKSGTFAFYHVYPYYPDFLAFDEDVSIYADKNGKINTYKAYLEKLNDYHTIPVVISEFGTPSSRGMAQKDINTGRNQGGMNEKEQGKAIISCYNDIIEAGCAGSIVFTWQDEWFKRTWNTMHAVDLLKTAYWSDYQTNEQYFGLLSFDPGEEKSICYVDGDVSEWKKEDIVTQSGDMELSMKQDEKYIYLLVNKPGLSENDNFYIPFDITPKTGAYFCNNYDTSFDTPADFVLSVDGRENTRLVVQERYNVLRAVYYHHTDQKDAYENAPPTNTAEFNSIELILQTATELLGDSFVNEQGDFLAETYETGLFTYGNANPQSNDFNSLADFCYETEGDSLEIKIPWQLLNFSNPAEGYVHDDYYLNYGVENLKIKEIKVGIGNGSDGEIIKLEPVKLLRWGMNPTYHERLKSSYYAIQSVWSD